MRRLGQLWRTRTADMLAGAIVVIVVGGAAAVVAFTPTQHPASLLVPEAAQPAVHSAASAVPSCRDVRSGSRAQCRADGGAVLALVDGAQPLLLPDVQARVLRARASAGGLDVRVRLRNQTSERRSLNEGSRQLYLSVAGRRLYADPVAESPRLAPGAAQTATLRFRLGKTRTRSADLTVLPYAELGRANPRRLGVIRLRFSPPPAVKPARASRPAAPASGSAAPAS